MTNFEAVPFWVGQWSKQRIIALSFWLWTYDLWPNVIDHSQWQKFMDKTLKKMSLTVVNDKKIFIYWKWSILKRMKLCCSIYQSHFNSVLKNEWYISMESPHNDIHYCCIPSPQNRIGSSARIFWVTLVPPQSPSQWTNYVLWSILSWNMKLRLHELCRM